MKRFSLKSIALKVDVIGPEHILFAGESLHRSARKFYRLGSEGVKDEKSPSSLTPTLEPFQRQRWKKKRKKLLCVTERVGGAFMYFPSHVHTISY